MIRRLAIAIVAALSVAPTLTGCAIFGTADPVNVTIPNDTADVQAIEPGASLAKYNYIPATRLYNGDTHIGHVFVACGETSVDECAPDLHNRGTETRPNVYVKNSKIVLLEGPHISAMSDSNYYVTVPEAYQDFAKLTPEQQKILLEQTIAEVIKQIGDPIYDTRHSLVLSIGNVEAWASRRAPSYY